MSWEDDWKGSEYVVFKELCLKPFFSSLNKLFRMGGWVGGWVAGSAGYKAISASAGAGAVAELGKIKVNK